MTSISKGASLLLLPFRQALHGVGQGVQGNLISLVPLGGEASTPGGGLLPTELWSGRGLQRKPGSAAYLEARWSGSTLLASFT